MTTKTACDEFIENPENFAGHVEECERCRAAVAELEKLDRALVVDQMGPRWEFSGELLGKLPIAPWEGAAHRAWSFAFVVGGILFFGAATLFSLGGISPFEGFRAVVFGSTPPVAGSLEAVGALSSLLAHVPQRFHILLGIAFVLVNLVFIALLRRSPRGYDASPR